MKKILDAFYETLEDMSCEMNKLKDENRKLKQEVMQLRNKDFESMIKFHKEKREKLENESGKDIS